MKANEKPVSKKIKNNKFLTIFVCIFLSVVLIFGTTMGIIMAISNARAVVKYDGITISEGEAKYLASVYKKEYIISLKSLGVAAYDSAAFWASEAEDGTSYGELMERGFKEYLCGIAIKNSLYLDNASSAYRDKSFVKEKVDKRLSYLGYNSEKAFNREAERLGFDYDDMVGGSLLLYRAGRAYGMIYGTDGANLAGYAEECERYLATYTHVSLIFLRHEDTYVLSEAGEVTYNDDGEIVMRALSPAEKAARETAAMELREYISNFENDENNAISPETFDIYMRKSDTDPQMYSRGYYFREGAEITAQFAAKYPEVVERAYEMDIGEYAEVACEDSVCFIYRSEVVARAYADRDNVFFSDFLSDGSEYLFGEAIKTLSTEVEITDNIGKIDLIKIPSNKEYYVNSWS